MATLQQMLPKTLNPCKWVDLQFRDNLPKPIHRLQNGRFDSPDRLFCSMADAWESASSSPADVKELIPEFYLPDARSELRKGLGFRDQI